MKIEEIKSTEWGEFCRAFSEANRGSLLTIELITADGIRSEIAQDQPLDRMTFDRTDACSDVISVSLGLSGERKRHHFIVDPIHLLVRKGEAGKKFLEIRGENGTTLVTFHSGRFPQTDFALQHEPQNRS